MKPFSAVALPHEDILQKRLTMDIFAADLWEVFKGRAPSEYKDPVVFSRKTHATEGLRNLLEIAEKRLKGEGGDSVIQLQTPFGGGKTHSLIALYHKGREWGANIVVFDGSSLDPRDSTPWEEMEYQLTGEIQHLKGKTSPGREKLRTLFEAHQPLLILTDEILTYAIKASGTQVGDSTLASQLLVFIQELTGTIRTLDKSLLLITLPSSTLEQYGESGERLFQQLQQILGRMEKIYTPVKEYEISYIVRRRLFSNVDEKEARNTIEEFLEYADKEKLLPEGVEKSEYREKFIRSYPFQPEVIDVLYGRWGSFTSFQRTRGVLRLLSLVLYSLKDSRNPYIRLSDFDLSDDELKRELIKYIGEEFGSVIYQDITAENSGAKKVDRTLSSSFTTFNYGTRAATTIFLYSHSGGTEKGVTISEVKLSAAEVTYPSSAVVEAIRRLEENLFYLQSDGRLFFTNQPNLNRMLVTKIDSLGDEIATEEKTLLSDNLKKEYFEIYTWPDSHREVIDTRKLKLVILRTKDKEACMTILENYGERPRVYKNTLIFLCPTESDRVVFEGHLKRKLGWELIENDKTLNLTPEQKATVKTRIREGKTDVADGIKGLYRVVLLPTKDGLEEIDLGHPTVGMDISIDKRVYNRLMDENKINKELSPLTIREKYLKERNFVETKKILESFLTTPGEIRIISENVLKNCIKEGVKKGLFGAGDVENGNLNCRYHRDAFDPELVEGEVLIKSELCKIEEPQREVVDKVKEEKTGDEYKPGEKPVKDHYPPSHPPLVEGYHTIRLRLKITPGKLSDIARMVTYVRSKFDKVDINIDISAQDGEIKISDYEDKITETINQANAEIVSEEMT
ncbi:MAG: DUF499 domain-containing protein [Candidatus Methanofastidiosia archaeon]